MVDPTANGRDGGSGTPTATGFAPERQASFPPEIASAYNSVMRAPAPPTFDQRWTVWGSNFGGYNRTGGNPVAGTNDITASTYGFGAGMDFHASANAVLGFALAGGGTNWGLSQALGGGRANSFEAGVYSTMHSGPGYLAASLAVAEHFMTTNRTAPLGDQLSANFNAQGFGGRLETGYRFAALPWLGVTPFSAFQVQWFHTPNYSETDLSGGGFGLRYSATSATDTRSELGARFDNLQVLGGMPLVLRARAAWAHDWVSNPSLGAVFQALPGSNFTVNGAKPPQDSALTSAAAELHINANWTASAKFDGEFASTSQTYAGTGTLKYSW
jgi:outer membrane autotransporter protein